MNRVGMAPVAADSLECRSQAGGTLARLVGDAWPCPSWSAMNLIRSCGLP